mmetsp:Transcript_25898/g.58376  ORF Transcript_25898/g.58376 Transcript_25898/m.58376 type:complete len:127 (+) Transcript_25898:307-687(+)
MPSGATDRSDEDELDVPNDSATPNCCAGNFCGTMHEAARKDRTAYDHICLNCNQGMCGASCGELFSATRTHIDMTKSDILSAYDDPYCEHPPPTNAMICKLCLDVLKIEGGGTSKGGSALLASTVE